MAKKSPRVIEVAGVVRCILADGQAEVELADGHCIRAEISAKIKVRLVSVRPGDYVRCQVSPYDPAKARIVDLS